MSTALARRDVTPVALLRFWSKVDKSDNCWVWNAAKVTGGYGGFKYAGVMLRAHRTSWELAYGAIPAGLLVCHKCDNPPCVNPDHLFLGTTRDNALDAKAKGRTMAGDRNGNHIHVERRPTGLRTGRYTHPETTARGETSGVTTLRNDDVKAIRNRYKPGVVTAQSLGREYGVSKRTVLNVLHRKTWAHVE